MRLFIITALLFLATGSVTFAGVEPLGEGLSLGESAFRDQTALVAFEDDSYVALSLRRLPTFPGIPQSPEWEPISRAVDREDDLGEIQVLGEAITQPRIGAARGGNRILAAWPKGSSGEVFGRLLDRTGQPISEVFTVGNGVATPFNVSVSGHQAGFAVSWSNIDQLWLRHYDLDGEPVTDQILVQDSDLQFGFRLNLGRTAVAASPVGSLVVWGWDYTFEGRTVNQVSFRRVSLEGTVGDGAKLMEQESTGTFRPTVAKRPDGGFVAAWTVEAGAPDGVWLQRFNDVGQIVGTPRRADPGNTAQIIGAPSIDLTPGGTMAIAWGQDSHELSQSVVVRAFDPLGHPMGQAIPVSEESTHATEPQIVFTAEGRLVVTSVVELDIPIGVPLGDPIGLVARRFALTCTPSDRSVCLREGRFEVSVELRDDIAPEGRPAMAVPTTSDTGSFWFFSEDNVELLIKVLDGRSVNDHFWVLFGSMSNVAYTVTVRDTITGAEREFVNPQGTLASQAITNAFPNDGSPPTATAAVQDAPGGGCLDTEMALCLTNLRFRATVEWRDPRSGDFGTATGRVLADNSGAFWFFGPENLEVILKVLDGTPSNGHHWVFVGGVTDLELDIRVDDQVTGNSWEYHKDPFKLESFADTMALPEAPVSFRD